MDLCVHERESIPMSCRTPAGLYAMGVEKSIRRMMSSFSNLFNPKMYFSSSLINANMYVRGLHIDKEKAFRRGNFKSLKDIFELSQRLMPKNIFFVRKYILAESGGQH